MARVAAVPASKAGSHFDDAQIVELTHLIALENYRGRFDLARGSGASGFSEGTVCALPEPQPGRWQNDVDVSARPTAA